jgi:putative RNA 2'-phosphotransferase
MSKGYTRTSKFLSLVLRHEPAKAGLTLDSSGWVGVDELLAGCAAAGVAITRAELAKIVAQNDKQRFAFSDNGQRIRANQGHSVEIDLKLAPAVPPEHLFHGTADRFLAQIRRHGLSKQQRHHVHLSATRETAIEVGKRHGRPVVLRVAAGEMARQGHPFYCSANGVWLTDSVPPQFLDEA